MGTSGESRVGVDAIAIEYAELRGFAPAQTHNEILQSIEQLSTAKVVDQFEEQLFRLRGEEPKVALKHPSDCTPYDDKTNSGLVKSASPSVGALVKTGFSSDAFDVHETLLQQIVTALGSVGIRRLHVEYTIDQPFETVRPAVDTGHDVRGIRFHNRGREYVIEQSGDATRAKAVKTEGAGVLVHPADVDLAELTEPDGEFLSQLELDT